MGLGEGDEVTGSKEGPKSETHEKEGLQRSSPKGRENVEQACFCDSRGEAKVSEL